MSTSAFMLSLATGLLLTASTHGASQVGRVQVAGALRTTPGAVLDVVETRVGGPLDPLVVASDLRRIHSLGLFDDVRAESTSTGRDVTVTFVVEERPWIVAVRLTGAEELPARTVRDALAVSRYELADRARIAAQVAHVSSLYDLAGFPLARVHWELRPAGPLAVKLVVDIDEGRPVSVRRIDLRGNAALSDADLTAKIATSSAGRWSVLTGTGRLSLRILESDRRAIEREYALRGFKGVSVRGPHVALTPGLDTADVVFTIDEGGAPGEPPALSKPLQIARVDIRGNRATRDAVIRRELDVVEGGLLERTDGPALQAAVSRLGLFERVDVRPTVRDDGRVDLGLHVAERRSFGYQLGGGWSESEAYGVARLVEHNLLGRGQSLAMSLRASELRQRFDLSLSEPRLLGSATSLRLSGSGRDEEWGAYDQRALSSVVELGQPLADSWRLAWRLRAGSSDWRASTGAVAASGNTVLTGISIGFDVRDDRRAPSRGGRLTASLGIADGALGSQAELVRAGLDGAWFISIGAGVVVRLRGAYTVVRSTSSDEVPLYERLFAGGPRSVRGFERQSLSPMGRVAPADPDDALQEVPIGGDERLTASAELELPLSTEVSALRAVLFADVGQVFCDQCDPVRSDVEVDGGLFASPGQALSALRMAVGLGVRWRVGAGALSFECGFPLSPRAGEADRVCELGLGW